MAINHGDMTNTQDEGYSSVFPSPVKKCPLFPATFDDNFFATEFVSPDRLAELLNFQHFSHSHHKNDQILLDEGESEQKSTMTSRSSSDVFILDCRSPFEFEHSHIKNSVNIVVPSILYKRLVKGTLSTPSLISTDNIRETFGRAYKTSLIVLVQETSTHDQDDHHVTGYENHVTNTSNNNQHHIFSTNQTNCTNGIGNVTTTTTTDDSPTAVSPLLYKKLREEGCDVRFIHGGLNAFYSQYPDLCYQTSSSTSSFSTVPSFNDNHHSQLSSIDIDHTSSSNHTLTSSQPPPVTSSLANRRKLSAERPCSLYYLDMKSLKLDDCGSSSDDSASTSGYSVSSCATSCSGDSCYVGGVCPEDPLLSSTNPISSGGIGGGGGGVHNDVFGNNDEMGLNSLCNQNQQNHHYHRQDAKFPVEIIPHLFLGNSTNSTDREILRKYKIKYILNVTPDLPNVFENDQFFRYLQIPIYDHWSQDLMVHFPAAINFIDEARQQHCGVLVHCLAGISRSVTVTVAYLMRTLSLCLEDAYDLVKNHKPNIAPNLNFMGQLLDFQRDLYGDDPPASSAANTTGILVGAGTPSSNAVGPGQGQEEGSTPFVKMSHHHPQQEDPSRPQHQDDPVTSSFLPAPLSAPPQRRDAARRTKRLAECF